MNSPQKESTGRNDSEFALKTLSFFMLGGVVAALLYSAQATTLWKFFTVFGLSLLIAGTFVLAGGLLGFLFGIPRTLQQEDETEVKGVGYRANTNLEQISDWLTKILVGVGLTQIGRIPDALNAVAETATAGLGDLVGANFCDCPHAVFCVLRILIRILVDAVDFWERPPFCRSGAARAVGADAGETGRNAWNHPAARRFGCSCA